MPKYDYPVKIREIDDLEIVACPGCHNSKAKSTCSTCNGSGDVVQRKIKHYFLYQKEEKRK